MKTKLYNRITLLFAVLALLLQACSNDYSDNDTNYEDRSTTESSTSYGQTSSDLNYEVGNRGASAYVFNSPSLSNVENPSLTLKRGSTYTFTINAPGHPFLIKTVQSASDTNTYNNGITNNGAESGTITFVVPANAPDTLYYVCEFHSSMSGVMRIED